METLPKIATVVVTYNRKRLLVECITAIENQSMKPTKLYIIDNASSDGTEEEIAKYEFSLPYEYIRLKENIGRQVAFMWELK